MRGEGRTVGLVILDGVADRPAPALDGETPLEAAATPQLDRLATAGQSGTMDIRAPGTPMSSDRAHAVLFGYDPAEVPGRGVLEARGFDVSVPADGVTCSASFAAATPEGDRWRITDRTVTDARPCNGAAAQVARFETAGVTVTFDYTWKNRGLVRLRPESGRLDPAVTDVDPFEAGLPVVTPAPLSDATDSDAAARTGKALAAYTRWTVDRLSAMPVDVVLSKWAGQPTDPEPFARRHGMAGATLTPKPVLQGLGHTLGMAVADPPANYDDRCRAALAALDDHAFVHVHYPEPDEVAHAASPAAKRDEIEAIDATLEPLVDRALADPDLVLAVTADHTTPSRGNVVHSGEPVPVALTGETVRRDDVRQFGERSAATGGLGRFAARDLCRQLRAAADRVLLDGLRRAPHVPDHPTTDLDALRRQTDDRT
jgi:2,3-bisphosphoglycerate-independent phosphoglycerate mutase